MEVISAGKVNAAVRYKLEKAATLTSLLINKFLAYHNAAAFNPLPTAAPFEIKGKPYLRTEYTI